MKNKIQIDFYCDSKKWPRRLYNIKKITKLTKKSMMSFFKKNADYQITLILSDQKRIKKLNKKYRNAYKDTDVLTFINNIYDKNSIRTFYCDIFFSIDTIEKFIKNNNMNLYDHFHHLLIHSFLHINGYDHKNKYQHTIMSKQEIKILKSFGISNPYTI